MLYIVIAALGLVGARQFSWFGVFVISTILAVALGLEGALHDRTLLKVLHRDWEVIVTFQSAYFAPIVWDVYGSRLMARLGR